MLASLEQMHSLEGVLKHPFSMNIMGYLNKHHQVPRYSFDKKVRYQYTDAQGLSGILTTNRIWASDIRFLNDPSENEYFVEVFFRELKLKENLTEAEAAVISAIAKAFKSPRTNVTKYVASLCGDGDLLSQWRGYGAFGEGYSIGFELGFGKPHPQLAVLHDVIYGSQEIRTVAHDLLEILTKSYLQHWPTMLDSIAEEWASVVRYLSASFKHEAYAEEQECRILASTPSSLFATEAPLKHRVSGKYVIPYVDMALDLIESGDIAPKLPIKYIVIGPGLDFDRAKAGVLSLLSALEYEDVEVCPSVIPFRAR